MGGNDPIVILGVEFFMGTAEEAVHIGMQGGLVVVPSAPVLCELGINMGYTEAIQNANLVIGDSMYMVLCWKLLQRENVPRISGLTYLKILLERLSTQKQSPFWVFPSQEASILTFEWLKKCGHPFKTDKYYIAPMYPPGNIEDPQLLEEIRTSGCRQVIICLGGGTQERVGYFIKRNLSPPPGIHCIGAAIGFLTGDQVHIPAWADRSGFGWLYRCFSRPSQFVPRYWRAIKLFRILARFRRELPIYNKT